SLARMRVANALEEAFHIRFTEDALYDIETCRDLVEYIADKTAPAAKRPAPSAAAGAPATTEDSATRIVVADFDETDPFPECVALAQRLANTAAAGLENPFFRVKEQVERTTV